MKTIAITMALFCLSAMADSLIGIGNFIGSSGGGGTGYGVPSNIDWKAERAKSEYSFLPSDMWRKIDNQAVYAKGEDWVQFIGIVVAVKPYGVFISGGYGKPPYDNDFNNRPRIEFIVKNYPYQAAYGDTIASSKKFTAKDSGVFSFTNTVGGTTTIHQLDYGKPCEIPPEIVKQKTQEIKDRNEAIRLADKKKRDDSEQRAALFLINQATNGTASVQYSLGSRYLIGNGVETNKVLAIYWLTQSANQGDLAASNQLVKLSAPVNKSE